MKLCLFFFSGFSVVDEAGGSLVLLVSHQNYNDDTMTRDDRNWWYVFLNRWLLFLLTKYPVIVFLASYHNLPQLHRQRGMTTGNLQYIFLLSKCSVIFYIAYERSFHWPTRSEQIWSELVRFFLIWNGSIRAIFFDQILTGSNQKTRSD